MDDLSQREEEFVDIWLELIDEYDSYTSPRRRLSGVIEGLILSIEQQNFGDLKQGILEANQIIEEVSNNSLEDVISHLESALPEISELEKDRDDLKTALDQTIEFDSEPVTNLEDWWINIDELRGRLYSQTSAHADGCLFESIEEDGVLDELSKIQSEISSEELISEYTGNLSSVIEEFLNGSEEYGHDELTDIVETIFSELLAQNWRMDDISKVLKRYVNRPEVDLEDKRATFIDKIRGNTDSLKAFVALPEAHLGGLTPLQVGGVTFYSIADEEIDIEANKHPKFRSVNFTEQSEIWASAEVHGATSKIKTRNLKEKVARSVDILNIGKSTGTLQFPFDNSYTVLQETSDGLYLPLTSTNDLSQVSYAEMSSEDDIQKRIDHFKEYLTSSAESPLEKSIASSIRWYRYANRSPEDEEKFLKYIISIESLLVSGELESKSDNIADRAIAILQLHTEFRPKYNKFFREVYDVRSEIVHSGARDLPEFQDQLDELERFAASLITDCQGYIDDCESIHEVVKKVEAEEEELRTNRIEDSPFDPGEAFNFEATLSTTGGSDIATLELEGEFTDDGRYVYYEADVEAGEYRSGVSLSSSQDYSLEFEVDGEEYLGQDVFFPETSLLEAFPKEQPERIKWYKIDPVE